MAYRALTDVLLGNSPPARAGELIPEHYVNMHGGQVPVDFERLVEAGAAEKVQKLGTMTRPELDARAVEEGVPSPEELPNKQAVIDTVEVDPATLTRAQLDEHAAIHGVEDPGSLPNKQAVLDAIAAAKGNA